MSTLVAYSFFRYKYLPAHLAADRFHPGLKKTVHKIKQHQFQICEKKLVAAEDKISKIIGQKSLEWIRQGQKLPPLPFHGLRHTAATMMINQGLPTKSISGRLGHTAIGTTMDIYGIT